MTLKMPVIVLHDFYIQKKKSRLSKRQQKIKANKLKPIPYQYLIPQIFPKITESSETFGSACEPSRFVILDGNTPGNKIALRTLVCGKFKTFKEGPQLLLEYLGYTGKEGDFIDEHLNIWPWLPGTYLQFIPRGYRHCENYPNCCELRFKASRSHIKKRFYSCTLPFFYFHQNEDGMFPSSDVLEVFGLSIFIQKTELKDMIIREGNLYEEEKARFLAEHPDFDPNEFYITVRKTNFCKVTPSSKNSSVDEIIAEVFAAEKIKAYGQNIWKLTVPWIVLDEDHNQMIPLNIYTPEVDCSGKKQVFAPGDVIYSETFLMGRVLSKEEWEHCSLNYYGIKDD